MSSLTLFDDDPSDRRRLLGWLEDRFREQQSWGAEKIQRLAEASGFSRPAIWSVVGDLPIRKQQIRTEDGRFFWEWSAEPGWPGRRQESVRREDSGPSPVNMMRQQLEMQRASLQQFENMLKQMETQGRKIQQIDEKIARLEGEAGSVASHWQLSTWLNAHGRRATADVLAMEGMRVRDICRRKGIAVPEVKVPNGQYMVRRWPIDAIRIWWPEFCERQGWPVEWRY